MDETLIKCVAEATGLSADRVDQIIKQWVMERGLSPSNLSMDQTREILVDILQTLFAEVAEGQNDFIKISG